MPDPTDAAGVVAAIEAGFAGTPHPGARFLQGSFDGTEPAEAIAPFTAIADWRAADPVVLDAHYTALSFLSEGGFRFFLPAWMTADVRGQLQTADPLPPLVMGFTRTVVQAPAGGRSFDRAFGGGTLVNPRRYGAMTFEDAARQRLSVFCREEAAAIVAYLRYRRETPDGLPSTRREIDAAIAAYWDGRARHAPPRAALDAHLAAEREYLNAIGVPG